MDPYILERWANFRVRFELVDVDAAEDADPSATSEAEISRLEQTHNRILVMDRKLASLEHNYFVLDGSFKLPNKTDNGEVGWWSGELSDANGNFTTPQFLDFVFTSPQSSVGFTVIFDEKANQYASDFKIEVFDAADNLMAEDIVTGNTLARYVSDMSADGYKRVRIVFTKTPIPYRRVRVSEVVFGVIETFEWGNLSKANLLLELSPKMENFPAGELAVTIKNTERKYNMINPSGVYKFLQEGQGLDVEIGIGPERDDLEYVNMGRFYFTSSSAEDDSMTAQIVGHNKIYGLSRGTYRKGVEGSAPVGAVIDDIIENSGANINVSISPVVAGRIIGCNVPVVSHREALRLAVQAARAVCYVDRNDTLVVTDLIEGAATDELNAKRMTSPPKVRVSDYINAVEVETVSFRDPDLTDDEIYKDIFVVSGTATIWISYNEARNVSASADGGTINAAEYYLRACKLTITASGTVTVTLTGRMLDSNEVVHRTTLNDGNPERVKRIENQLVRNDQAAEFLSWALAMEQKRVTYQLPERGNPAREIGDTVKVYDAYGENRNAIITKQEFIFDGTLQADSEAWGGGI